MRCKRLLLFTLILIVAGFLGSKDIRYEVMGDKYFKEKNFKKAEKYYKKAIKKNPRDAKLRLKLAITYKKRGKIDKCLKELIRATNIDPDFEKPYIYLGDFFYLSKKYDRALKAYLNLIRINPDSPKYHYKTAKILLKMHRDTEALKHFYRTIQLDNTFSDAIPYLKELLKREILKNPDNPEPHIKLGNVLYFGGELQKAKIQYLVALDKNPENLKVWYKLLRVCKELKECNCTLKSYEAILQFFPSSEDIVGDIIHWAEKCGEKEKLIFYLKRELDLDPENYEVLKKLGDIYRNKREDLNAYYYYRLYLKNRDDRDIKKWCENFELINPNVESMYRSLLLFNKGVNFFRQGIFKKALNFFKKACSIYCEYPQLHYYMGRTLYELGEIKSSLFEYKKAILKDNYNFEYWFYLGISLDALKKFRDAAICFRKCIEFSSNKNSIYCKNSYKYLKKYRDSGIIKK